MVRLCGFLIIKLQTTLQHVVWCGLVNTPNTQKRGLNRNPSSPTNQPGSIYLFIYFYIERPSFIVYFTIGVIMYFYFLKR